MVGRKESRANSMANQKALGADMAAAMEGSDPRPWWKQSHLIRLNLSLLCCILFSSANGYDGSLMNGLQALDTWQTFMDKPVGAWLGFINAIQSLGAVCSYPVVIWFVGRFGRKKSVAMGYLFLALGVGLQAGASSHGMFIAGRFFIGGVTGFYSTSAPLLITEVAHPGHRSVATALYNTGWYVGSLIAAWAVFGTRNYVDSWGWRVPSLLQIVIPVFVLPGFLMVPESPRWLISKDRVEEARAILVKYHAGGDENSKLVAFEMEEITRTLKLEQENKANTSYADLWATKGNRHRLFISITLGIFTQWNGVGIVSYYLAPVLAIAGITSVTQQTLINGCLQIWNLIIAVTAATFVDRTGRRFLFFVSTTGMLISYIITTALSGSFANTGDKNTGLAVIPFLFLYYGSYDIAFTPLVVSYTSEIWPYALRSRGLASALFSTQLAIFFNVFVNPIALNAIAWKYYIVFLIILVIILVTVYFFYPETNGHTLEEMVRVFDGPDAAVPEEGTVISDVVNRDNKGSMAYKTDSTNGEHVEDPEKSTF